MTRISIARWRSRSCRTRAQFSAPDGIPNLRLDADPQTETVRQFYDRAPFPGYPLRDRLWAFRAHADPRRDLGLIVVGKPVGITAAAWATVRLRLGTLPEGVNWMALHGCAWLGGIGFTMSLFIGTLAFQGTSVLDSAKVGILGGSVLAGVVGSVVVRRGTRSRA